MAYMPKKMPKQTPVKAKKLTNLLFETIYDRNVRSFVILTPLEQKNSIELPQY